MSGTDRRRLWRPANLPWRAKTKGNTADYSWFEVIDSDGNEVLTLPGAPAHKQDELFNDLALILTSVNRSPVIVVDENEIEIEWGGEPAT